VRDKSGERDDHSFSLFSFRLECHLAVALPFELAPLLRLRNGLGARGHASLHPLRAFRSKYGAVAPEDEKAV